ncbi:hypothetical protein [Chachezhania sediminis]|uniref:hypothetical protein n=1 Tax=Chachezhania sediminis TaxID=2599291 RepID=UPI00131BCAFF|nr:hypothetical protein [Chachezhania sediminis]
MNRLINMIMAIFIRKAVKTGVDVGMDALSGKKKGKSGKAAARPEQDEVGIVPLPDPEPRASAVPPPSPPASEPAAEVTPAELQLQAEEAERRAQKIEKRHAAAVAALNAGAEGRSEEEQQALAFEAEKFRRKVKRARKQAQIASEKAAEAFGK